MHLQIWLTATLTLLGLFTSAMANQDISKNDKELLALGGEWIFVEDRTTGRALEQLGPPMASKFSMNVEDGVVILNGHGSGHKDVRISLDGSVTEIAKPQDIARYRGEWKDGAFEYEVKFERLTSNNAGGIGSIRRKFQNTPEGLIVSVTIDPPSERVSIGLYRHAEDIPMPAAASATIDQLDWLAGAWVGTKITGSSIEERWSPSGGGAMLAISRTINAGGKMVGFEYLRIIEREGSLVYIAQPGGKTPTEFVLTEVNSTRAIFENPRHDYPKRIVYEVSDDGTLSTTIGQSKGGTPLRVDLKRSTSF